MVDVAVVIVKFDGFFAGRMRLLFLIINLINPIL